MNDEKKIIDGYALARSILKAGMEANDSMTMMVAGFITGFINDEQEIIVKCKNCKWKNTKACFCKSPKDVHDDWFCSEGERT